MLFNRKAAKDKTLQPQEAEDKLNEKLEAVKGTKRLLKHKYCIIFVEQYCIAVSTFHKIYFCTSDVSASKIASD